MKEVHRSQRRQTGGGSNVSVGHPPLVPSPFPKPFMPSYLPLFSWAAGVPVYNSPTEAPLLLSVFGIILNPCSCDRCLLRRQKGTSQLRWVLTFPRVISRLGDSRSLKDYSSHGECRALYGEERDECWVSAEWVTLKTQVKGSRSSKDLFWEERVWRALFPPSVPTGLPPPQPAKAGAQRKGVKSQCENEVCQAF